jgi:hypothetical protein
MEDRLLQEEVDNVIYAFHTLRNTGAYFTYQLKNMPVNLSITSNMSHFCEVINEHTINSLLNLVSSLQLEEELVSLV